MPLSRAVSAREPCTPKNLSLIHIYHLAHIDTKLAEAVGANLGIELSDDQRNITLPAPVNGVEKDPSLSLYADAEGDVKGRVVAVLLNERTSAQDLVQLLQALQAQGCLLYTSRCV